MACSIPVACRRLVQFVLAISLGVTAMPPMAGNLVDASMTSPATLEGTATLGEFPCIAPFPPGCPGSFAGTMVATIAGLDTSGKAYVAQFPDPTPGHIVTANFTASFGYNEPCDPFPVVLPPTGQAAGTFTLVGGLLRDNGVETHDATLAGSFAWQRIGLAADFAVIGATLTNNSNVTVATNVLAGQGAGTFVPTSGLAWCTQLNATETAKVAGVHLTPA